MSRFIYRVMDLSPWILLGVAAYVEHPGHDPGNPWFWLSLAAIVGFMRRIAFGYCYPDGLVDEVAAPSTCSVRVVSLANRESRAKINAIKIVRTYRALGLKEAKELVEMPVPITIVEGANPETANRLAADLSACGYEAEVIHDD